MKKFKRIMVTGGAGFIGHRVVQLLCAQGVTVSVLDNLSVGMPMPPARNNLFPYQVDIRDKQELARTFDEFKPDAVIHLAAIHHIPTCENERDYALDVNIVGTERLLAECERLKTEFILLASSGAVYAPIEGRLYEDTTPHDAIDNYSLCKISNEQQLKLWSLRTQGTVRIARIFNTIGHDDPNGHLIPDILTQIDTRNASAQIKLGNTAPRRDYIHADDTAAGIVALATNGAIEAPVEAFNVSCGVEHSVADIVTTIGELTGIKILWKTEDSRFRRVDRPSLLGAIDKIRNRTGWQPKYDLKEAIYKVLKGRNFQMIPKK